MVVENKVRIVMREYYVSFFDKQEVEFSKTQPQYSEF